MNLNSEHIHKLSHIITVFTNFSLARFNATQILHQQFQFHNF